MKVDISKIHLISFHLYLPATQKSNPMCWHFKKRKVTGEEKRVAAVIAVSCTKYLQIRRCVTQIMFQISFHLPNMFPLQYLWNPWWDRPIQCLLSIRSQVNMSAHWPNSVLSMTGSGWKWLNWGTVRLKRCTLCTLCTLCTYVISCPRIPTHIFFVN